uniref:NADH-ubiquinone oxidoreductase chain 1 n=1 Tax=Helorus sp. ZJUH_2016017 TaxID=2491159 RepID=A0A3Q8UA35_9HYME|nr:NADH dehydrogenase subunit 1 [Helorus sp. ZJUH_2016017]
MKIYLNYMMINFLIFFLNLILLLMSVAFVTLFERKILGLIQNRIGPNKVGFIGIFQPFSDAIKLFSKEVLFNKFINYYYYLISPIFMFLLMMLIWLIKPYKFNLFILDKSFLMFFSFLSLGVYFIMICGWASNSIYSIIGAIRSMVQTISYEVSLMMMLLSINLMIDSFNFYDYFIYQKYLGFFLLFLPNFVLMFILILCETNRTPFDLSEGESELVSGFNIEYMSGLFALLFLSEYGMIIFLSFMYVYFFFSSNLFILKVMFFIFLFIWIRGSYPRIRYDQMMMMNWLMILPIILNILIFVISFKFFLFFCI